MIQKTKNYSMFIFRDDNREKIEEAHIQKLMESIQAMNLLELRPILVNEKMEIIDGQHRLKAAERLGVEIYYEVKAGFSSQEVRLLSVNKSWTVSDWLNSYVKDGYPEYIKFKDFMKKNDLNIQVALYIVMARKKCNYKDFRDGKFVFSEEGLDEALDLCRRTIDLIVKMNGGSPYTRSSRFWNALLKLVNHPSFNEQKWFSNLKKMVNRVTAKASTEDYAAVFMEIFNFRNADKIDITDLA